MGSNDFIEKVWEFLTFNSDANINENLESKNVLLLLLPYESEEQWNLVSTKFFERFV